MKRAEERLEEGPLKTVHKHLVSICIFFIL